MGNLGVVNFGAQPHNVELREVERPTIGAEDVLVEVELQLLIAEVDAQLQT